MLGKLIKHEMKVNFKIMAITHGFILLLAFLLGGGLWIRSMNVESNLDWSTGILTVYVILLFVAMAAISIFGTQLYVAVRFYKNLFTDEGYLMYTLPTSPTQLLHSKIITGSLLILFNLLIVGLSALIVYTPLITQTLGMGDTFQYLLETIAANDVVLLCISYLLDLLAALIQIYGCICIGQLFHKNRLVAAIVAFLGTNLIKSFINMLLTFTVGTSYSYSINATYSGANAYTTSSLTSYAPTFILSIIMIGVFYFVSYYIMNKKLNLV